MAVLTTDVSVPERSAEDAQPSHSETTYFGMIEDPDYSDDDVEQSGHMHIAGAARAHPPCKRATPGEIPKSWYRLCGEPSKHFGLIVDPDYSNSDEEQAGNMHVNIAVGDGESSDSMGLGSGPEMEPDTEAPPTRHAVPAASSSQIPLSSDPVFKFGKYKNHTMQFVTVNHFDYFTWAASEKRPGKFLTEYIEWVHTNYDVDNENRNATRRSSTAAPRNAGMARPMATQQLGVGARPLVRHRASHGEAQTLTLR